MTPFHYNVGGCLRTDSPNYVVRQADVDLYRALQAGEFCYIFSSRQMGKSSLLVRVKDKLQQEGAHCAYLDMTRLGSDGLTQMQWYAGVVMSLLQSLGLSKQINFRQWWQRDADLTLVQRLNQLVEEVLIPAPEGPPLYIFIDEIDSLLSLDFSTDDFFAWMRSCYNQRAHDPRYRRLTFALFGVATPSDLIADKQRTPFNLGRAIPLTGFTLEESAPLQPGLEPWVDQPRRVLRQILDWTGGQPFLTQKLCDLAVQTASQAETVPLALSPGMVEVWVDGVVRSRILDHWESQDEPIHLRTIRDRLFWYTNRTARLLGLYQQLLAGEPVYTDDSREQIDLLLSGLVVRRGNQLFIKNPIYRQVFTPAWVERQLRRLRPYAQALDAWVASGRQDETSLLQGQALLDAEAWAREKTLTDLDYQFLAASQDAERQRIQHLLDAKQESERFFRQLAEAVPQIVWIVEPDGNLSYTNQQGNDFSGLPLESLAGQQRINVVHPDDRSASLAAWANAHATGEPYEVQLRMRDAEGNYRWFLNRAVPIRDAQGQIVKWFGTSTDLDDVKRTEEAKRLKEVEKRLVEQEKRQRLQRWLLGSISVAFLLSSTLGLFAWSQKRQFAVQEVEAIANQSEAQFASGNRLDALVTALKAQSRLNRLWQPPIQLVNQVDRDLRRATFLAVERNRMQSDLGRVRGVAVSPDGQLIASAHGKTGIILWDAAGNRQVTVPHKSRAITFSPEGNILASAGDDNQVRLWSRAGEPLRTLSGHQKPLMTVAFSPDGQWLASAGNDDLIKLWQIDGTLVHTLRGHQDLVWQVAFSPDGRWLASASSDGTVKIWGLDGQLVRTIDHPQINAAGEHRFYSLAFVPQPTSSRAQNVPFLVAGDQNGTMFWWDAAGTLLNTAAEHRNAVVSLAFSLDGQTLASASWDGSIKLWSVPGTMLQTLDAHTSGTLALQFMDGQRLVSGGEDNHIRLWQLDGTGLTKLRGHQASVWGVKFAPDGQTLVSSSTDGRVKRWTVDGQPVFSSHLNDGEVWAVATRRRGIASAGEGTTAIATAHQDGTVALWTETGTLVQALSAHGARVFDLAFSPDGTELASVGWDGHLRLWQPNGTPLQTLAVNPDPVTEDLKLLHAVAFSPDQQSLAIGGGDGYLHLWRRDPSGKFPPQPQQSLQGHEYDIWAVAFSPDCPADRLCQRGASPEENSQVLATASEDTTIKLWSLDGELLQTLTGHRDRVNGLIFIPANSGLPDEWGTVLASASWDKTIKLWSLDGTLRLTLEGHEDRVLDLDFFPATDTHGPLLVSGGLDDVAIVWPLDQVLTQEQIVQQGCRWIQDYVQTQPGLVAQLNHCQ